VLILDAKKRRRGGVGKGEGKGREGRRGGRGDGGLGGERKRAERVRYSLSFR